MEQKFTKQKFEKIEFKKSMFNVKMFSLMKKQLFSFVIALALIVIAGTSAWAQGLGTQASPLSQLTGSTHVFHATSDGGTHTYTWTVRDAGDDTDPTGEYTGTAAAGDYTVNWTDDAGGAYYIQVIDQNQAGCTTTRRFYVTIFTFDVRVFASTSDGATDHGNGWETCGDNNAAAGYIFDNVQAGTSLVTVNPDGDGSLDNSRGTIHSTQWFSFALTFDAGITHPTYTGATFDYVITATNTSGASVTSDVYQFNGETPDGAAAVTGAGDLYVSPIVFFDRWDDDNDITYSIQVSNFTLMNGATIIGQEKASNVVGYPSTTPQQNTSGNVILNAAPGTSVISVD